jgi:hypothetical protein
MCSTKMRTAIVVSIVVSLGATSSLMLFSGQAMAQLAAVRDLQGGGPGTTTCPDGSTNSNTNIIISAFHQKKIHAKEVGTVQIQTPSFGPFKQGFIIGGTIKQGSYNLQAIQNQDTLCGTPGSVTVTVSGLCGTGVAISYVAADGEKGSFTGNVACFA